jgi:hypothetical protein
MARGWESKSVESQQEERASRAADAGPEIPDPAAAAARRTLQMARARAEADLQNARNPAHRAMLEQAITALTAQLNQTGDRDA